MLTASYSSPDFGRPGMVIRSGDPLRRGAPAGGCWVTPNDMWSAACCRRRSSVARSRSGNRSCRWWPATRAACSRSSWRWGVVGVFCYLAWLPGGSVGFPHRAFANEHAFRDHVFWCQAMAMASAFCFAWLLFQQVTGNNPSPY